MHGEETEMNQGQTRKERNLDRAIHLAANGRIKPTEVIETAAEFDSHCDTDK